MTLMSNLEVKFPVHHLACIVAAIRVAARAVRHVIRGQEKPAQGV
jgi:hypothetical protein